MLGLVRRVWESMTPSITRVARSRMTRATHWRGVWRLPRNTQQKMAAERVLVWLRVLKATESRFW